MKEKKVIRVGWPVSSEPV